MAKNTPGANLHQNCAHEHGFRFTGWWVRGQLNYPVIHNWGSFLQFLDITFVLIFSFVAHINGLPLISLTLFQKFQPEKNAPIICYMLEFPRLYNYTIQYV